MEDLPLYPRLLEAAAAEAVLVEQPQTLMDLQEDLEVLLIIYL
jgi:hypothetical protein